MTPAPAQPKVQLTTTPDYRESYANSVQIRVNIWDFFLLFGTINQTSPETLNIQSFQGVYLSPQQAKALLNVLQQNIKQYESAFGEIRLEAQGGGATTQREAGQRECHPAIPRPRRRSRERQGRRRFTGAPFCI